MSLISDGNVSRKALGGHTENIQNPNAFLFFFFEEFIHLETTSWRGK